MTWNKRILRGRVLFLTFCAIGAALVYAYTTASNVVRAQYEDGTELYLDDPSAVSTFAQTVSPVFASDLEFTPDDAYRQLAAGNARYLREDSTDARLLPKRGGDAAKFPIATIVYSPDMPTRPTTLTQTTNQDLYLTSVEFGAVATQDLTAIEYGLVNLQTPLLVVMGHYPSRAVSDMIREYDRLSQLAQSESSKLTQSGIASLPQRDATQQLKRYNLIGPAIARSKEAYPDLSGYDLANVVSEALVWQSMETILMKSSVTQDLVRAGRLNVIAAIVDDQTGKIYWLGTHPLQDEFLKPVPDGLADPQSSGAILTESDFPDALDDSTIQTYVDRYENNPYYNEIVYQYYTDPIYYQPSWELFSRRAWCYRPWCGIWIARFTPWPYWYPWTPPAMAFDGIGACLWDGHINFYIGYNRYVGAPVYYDPRFRPVDPYWASEYYMFFDRRVHDPVYDLIIAGRRAELPPPIHHHPVPGYHPGAARPGVGFALSLGGIKIGFGTSGGRPGDFRRPGGPGGPGGPIAPPDSRRRGGDPRRPDGGIRPNDPTRPGGGVRPGEPMQPGGGIRPINPARPGEGARPGGGARPGDPIRPGGVRPTNPARPGGGARPGDPISPDGVRPTNPARPGGGARPGDPISPGGVRPTNPAQPGGGARPGDSVRPGGGIRPIDPVRPGGASEPGRTSGARPGGRSFNGAATAPTQPNVTRPSDSATTALRANPPAGVSRRPLADPGLASAAPSIRNDASTRIRASRPDFSSLMQEGRNESPSFNPRPNVDIGARSSVAPRSIGTGTLDRPNLGARPSFDFGSRPTPSSPRPIGGISERPNFDMGTRASAVPRPIGGGTLDRPNFGARPNVDFGPRPSPAARPTGGMSERPNFGSPPGANMSSRPNPAPRPNFPSPSGGNGPSPGARPGGSHGPHGHGPR